MIEIGIGVLFAVIFVAAYLLVSKLLGSGEHGQSRWRELINQPFCGTKAVNARPSGLFLTTGEMREHHSQRDSSVPAENSSKNTADALFKIVSLNPTPRAV